MRDPMTVAHKINRPWPNKVAGYWHWPTLITVWHKDPLGDVGPPCHNRRHWRLHVHHMKIHFDFWNAWWRRHFTHCAWCNGRWSKDDPLNFGIMGDDRTFHQGCLTKYTNQIHAHNPNDCWPCQHKA